MTDDVRAEPTGAPASSYPRSPRSTFAAPSTLSPLVDAEGAGWALSTSTAGVVRLSAARRRQLAAAAAEGRRTLLLTRGGSVLTPALHDLLPRLGGRWIVQTDAGLRDAATGARLERPSDVLAPTAEEPVGAPEHADIPFDEDELVVALSITASIRHPNPARAPLGAVLARIAAAMLPEPRLSWGLDEPVTLAWDDEEVAASLRARLGRAAMTFAAGTGADGRRIVGSVAVDPTKRGAEEIVAATIALGATGDPLLPERLATAVEGLEACCEVGVPLFAMATARLGHPQLHRWPWLGLAVAPMSILIGAPGVSRFGLREGPIPLEERFAAAFVGPARRESLLVELGEEPSPANLVELRELIAALGAELAAETIPVELLAACFGDRWQGPLAAEHARLAAEHATRSEAASAAAASAAAAATADAADGDQHASKEPAAADPGAAPASAVEEGVRDAV